MYRKNCKVKLSYFSHQIDHKNVSRKATTLQVMLYRNVVIVFFFLSTFFPGQVELNLNRMPKPAKSARRCSLQQLPSFEEGRSSSSVETVSLFEMKRVYGWWPCVAQDPGEEMQLTVRSNGKQDPKGDIVNDRGENGQFYFCLRSAHNIIWPRSSVDLHTRRTKLQFESIQTGKA